MGGSTKKVQKYVADRTGYTGSDLDTSAQAVGDKGSEAIEYTKKKGSEVIEGAKEHGGALATGLGQGLGKLGTTAMAGLKHNLDQVAGVFMPRSGGGEEGETEATANYSGSSKKGKAAGSAEGRMGKNRERLAKRDALKVRK